MNDSADIRFLLTLRASGSLIAPRRAAFVAGSSYDMFGTAAVGLRTYWHNHIGLPLVDGAPAPEIEAASQDRLMPWLAGFGGDRRP